MREVERYVILQVVDSRWREHLDSMDYLRDGIHLRAMAQKDPLVEYRAEGHKMFEELSGTIREEVVLTLFHAQVEVSRVDEAGAAQSRADASRRSRTANLAVRARDAPARRRRDRRGRRGRHGHRACPAAPRRAGGRTQGTVVNDETQKVGRNDPCWCG